MAGHRFGHLLRPQSYTIPALHPHHFPAIPALPEALSGCSTTSTPKSVPSNFSRGIGNPREYDGIGVRARVGSGHGYPCLGFMVDHQRAGAHNLLPFDLGHVSAPIFVFLWMAELPNFIYLWALFCDILLM